MLAFAATLQASWEAIGASMSAGLENGGPVALIYGLILTIIGSLAMALSLAELASMLVDCLINRSGDESVSTNVLAK